jgi:5-methyltetrahydropteroyltriglutamate--homocysteine methyltransferase
MALPYRADHIGSFLRPKDILDARERGVSHDELKAIEDREILKVLAKQKELGFGIFTDGELRRAHFMSDLTDAVDGFDMGTESSRRFVAGAVTATAAKVMGVVTSKVVQRKKLTADELPFLKEHSPGPIKMTLPSATQFPANAYKKGISDKVYPTYSDFLADITKIVADECRWLAEQGVAYIQIDAPRYSYYVDPKWRDWLKNEFGRNPDEMLDEAIAADNAAFRAAKRPGVTLGIHLCRGNNRSQWYAEGGYDPIAEKIFNELECDRFLLEYDDARSGDFTPLRFVPNHRIVELGLISTKLDKVEKADDIIFRIEEAAKSISLENLALSPQCGFASMMEGNVITEAEQWEKLKLVVDIAKRIWGEA